ncbi:MAG: DUF2723 domain-containing protein [Kofleriaceae bacterium]
MRRFLIDRGGAITLVVLGIYLWLAPTTIVDGDNAEFARLGAIGGRGHPSGYPAYVMFLRLLSWIPGASPAHTAALATALLGAATILVMHAACRAWGARPLAATIACAVFATGPVVLRTHTEAEVFAGNALVVMTVLWLAAVRGPARGVLRCGLLGLVAGLGLANHLTCSLVAPVGVLGAVRGIRETSGRTRLVAAAAAIAGLAIGLSAYLYLVVTDAPGSYGAIHGFGDLLAFFLREDYGGFSSFVPTGVEVLTSTNLFELVATLGRTWLWLPALAGIVMLGYGIARPVGETRWGWALLAVCFVIAGPILVTRFNIEPKGIGLYVIHRFHLLPALLLAIPVAVAIDRLAVIVAERAPAVRIHAGLAHAVIAAGVIALVVVALPRLRAVHSPALDLQMRYLLRSLPPDAVVLSGSEDICFAADYLQLAEGVRPDVFVGCWILASRPWFRERMIAAHVPLLPRYTHEPTREQVDLIVAKRPLFVDRSFTKLLTDMPSYPYGIVSRVLATGASAPPLVDVLQTNEELYRGFTLDYPHPEADDDFAALAHQRYAAPWFAIARALRGLGDDSGAATASELARSYFPTEVRP